MNNGWLSKDIVMPVRPLPETEGIQGALSFLYNEPTSTKSSPPQEETQAHITGLP
jgi:hypothetical protein